MSTNLVAALLLRQPGCVQLSLPQRQAAVSYMTCSPGPPGFFSAKLLSVLLVPASAAVWGYSVPDAELAFPFLELPGIFVSLSRLL